MKRAFVRVSPATRDRNSPLHALVTLMRLARYLLGAFFVTGACGFAVSCGDDSSSTMPTTGSAGSKAGSGGKGGAGGSSVTRTGGRGGMGGRAAVASGCAG